MVPNTIRRTSRELGDPGSPASDCPTQQAPGRGSTDCSTRTIGAQRTGTPAPFRSRSLALAARWRSPPADPPAPLPRPPARSSSKDVQRAYSELLTFSDCDRGLEMPPRLFPNPTLLRPADSGLAPVTVDTTAHNALTVPVAAFVPEPSGELPHRGGRSREHTARRVREHRELRRCRRVRAGDRGADGRPARGAQLSRGDRSRGASSRSRSYSIYSRELSGGPPRAGLRA
jgi:hypothetical protein